MLRKRNTCALKQHRKDNKMPPTTPETQSQGPLLDLEEAANFFRVSRTTFFELRKSPKFPAPVRIMGKTLFLIEDLMKYALSRKVEKRC